MDFDLNRRTGNFLKEQERRKQEAKRKLEKEKAARERAANAAAELAERQKQLRLQRLKELEEAEERRLEEERITGGIRYSQILRPVPSEDTGDKVTLPVSALEELNPQDAISAGIVLTFELTSKRSGKMTHCGVKEFTAEEGTIGIPPKVARSLCSFGQSIESAMNEGLHVKYIRMPKGTFARIQPLGEGFQEHDIDLKPMLERVLRTHTTLSEGDILLVRHKGRTFELGVRELQPESRVVVINTDLEVEVMVSEAAERYQEEERRKKEKEAAALKAEEDRRKAVEENRARKRELIASESPKQTETEPGNIISIHIRLPSGHSIGRDFSLDSRLQTLFDLVEAESNLDILPGEFQLSTRFPRRVLSATEAERRLADIGFSSKKEALFFERVTSPESFNVDTGHVDVEEKEKAPAPSLPSPPRPKESSRWLEAEMRAMAAMDKQLLAEEESRPIHAVEKTLPVRRDVSDPSERWREQLKELEEMGFPNTALNIQLLERYQGRLLRVVNYLSEMEEEAS